MLTRLDYAAIAAVFNCELSSVKSAPARKALCSAARLMADVLGDRNANFTRARFLEACGVPDKAPDTPA